MSTILGYSVSPVIWRPAIVLDCNNVYSFFFGRKKKLVRKFLHSAGPNIWRYLSKASWRFLDFLDASGQRVRKTFRGFTVKADRVEVFLLGFFVEFDAHC
jgi:hypothetical protein